MARKPTRDMDNIAIYKTRSGDIRYRVRFRRDGESRTASFATVEEARRKRDEMKYEPAGTAPQASAVTDRENMTVVDFIGRLWWEERAMTNLNVSTRKDYRRYIKRLIVPSPIGGLRASDLDSEHVLDWVDWCRKKPKPGATDSVIRSTLKVISGAYSWGADRPRKTGIKGNHVPRSAWPKEIREHDVVIVDQEVIERFRQQILRSAKGSPETRKRDALLLSLMAQTGMRPMEARGLRVQDVRNDEIDLTETKTKKKRTVPLWAPLAEDIDDWVTTAGLSGEDFLVGNLDGRKMSMSGWENWRSRVWNPARDAVARKPEVNDGRLLNALAYDVCRHSYAAQQEAALMPVSDLSKVMGHSVAVLSRHYSKPMPGRDPRVRVDPEQSVVAARKKIAAELDRPGCPPCLRLKS